jgi:hypothetical protein
MLVDCLDQLDLTLIRNGIDDGDGLLMERASDASKPQ